MENSIQLSPEQAEKLRDQWPLLISAAKESPEQVQDVLNRFPDRNEPETLRDAQITRYMVLTIDKLGRYGYLIPGLPLLLNKLFTFMCEDDDDGHEIAEFFNTLFPKVFNIKITKQIN